VNALPYGRRATDRPEHRKKLLEVKRANLERLQLQAAEYGPNDVPLKLANDIAQLEVDVSALEIATQPAVPSAEVLDSLGPTGQWQATFRAILDLQSQVVEQRTIMRRWLTWLSVVVVSLGMALAALAVEVLR
jgi:hypothetical protein